MLQNLYDGILILYLIINNKYENIVLNNATLAASLWTFFITIDHNKNVFSVSEGWQY